MYCLRVRLPPRPEYALDIINVAQCRNYYRHLQSQGLVPEASESEDQAATATPVVKSKDWSDETEQHAAEAAPATPAASGTVPGPAPAAGPVAAPVPPSQEVAATEEESDKENEAPNAPEPKRPVRRDRKREAGPTEPAAAVSDRAENIEKADEDEDATVEDVGTDDAAATAGVEDVDASDVLRPASSDEDEEELLSVVPRRSTRGWRKTGEPAPSLPQRTPSPLATPSSPIESSPRGFFVPVVLPTPVPRPPPKIAWVRGQPRAMTSPLSYVDILRHDHISLDLARKPNGRGRAAPLCSSGPSVCSGSTRAPLPRRRYEIGDGRISPDDTPRLLTAQDARSVFRPV